MRLLLNLPLPEIGDDLVDLKLRKLWIGHFARSAKIAVRFGEKLTQPRLVHLAMREDKRKAAAWLDRRERNDADLSRRQRIKPTNDGRTS